MQTGIIIEALSARRAAEFQLFLGSVVSVSLRPLNAQLQDNSPLLYFYNL